MTISRLCVQYRTECRSPRQTQYQQQKRCLPLYKYTNKPLQRRTHTQCPHEEINSANINECLQTAADCPKRLRFQCKQCERNNAIKYLFPSAPNIQLPAEALECCMCLPPFLTNSDILKAPGATLICWSVEESRWSCSTRQTRQTHQATPSSAPTRPLPSADTKTTYTSVCA